MDLDSLYTDIKGLSDEEAETLGQKLYREEFSLTEHRGYIQIAPDVKVYFFMDQYMHAFRSSEDRIRHEYSKAKIARDRIARIRWIKPVLQGKISNTEYWTVLGNSGHKKRLYVVVDKKYIIWLESRKDGHWRFSTAYTTDSASIGRYTKGGHKTVLNRTTPRD